MTKLKIIKWLKGSLDSEDIHADVDLLVRILEGRTGLTKEAIDLLLEDNTRK